MVKIYERHVREAAIPEPRRPDRLTGEAFGAGEARNLSQFGGIVEGVASKLAQHKDKTDNNKNKAVVRESLNGARSEVRQFVSELYTRQGKEAVDVYDESEKFLTEARKKYLENLEDDNQREHFSASYDGLMNSHLNRVLAFQDKARKEYTDLTLDAENKNAIDDAVASREDNVEIAESEATVVANTRAKYAGQDKAVVDKEVKAALNNLHSTVLKATSDDDPEAGQAYLKKNWDKFDPKTREGIKGKLNEMAESVWVRRKATEISDSGKTLEQQYAEIDKIKDPDKAAKTKRLVEDRNNDKKSVKDLAIKERYEGEYDTIAKDPIAYKGVPPSFEADKQQHLYNVWQNFRKDELAKKGIGAKIQTDWDVYNKLLKMPQSQFMQEDIIKYSGQLGSAEMKELIKMQSNGKGYTTAQSLNTYLNQLTKDVAEDDFERQSFVREMFENELNTYPQDQKNKMETWQKIKDNMFMEVDVKGSVFDTTYWEARYGDKEVVAPDEMPKGVPKGSIWVDETIDGTIYRGWEYTFKNGKKNLYKDGQWYEVK